MHALRKKLSQFIQIVLFWKTSGLKTDHKHFDFILVALSVFNLPGAAQKEIISLFCEKVPRRGEAGIGFERIRSDGESGLRSNGIVSKRSQHVKSTYGRRITEIRSNASKSETRRPRTFEKRT